MVIIVIIAGDNREPAAADDDDSKHLYSFPAIPTYRQPFRNRRAAWVCSHSLLEEFLTVFKGGVQL
jgi:hypothetical protein